MIFIMKKINIISRCSVAYRNDILKDKTLSPLYHSYVIIISKNPGISQDELADELCVNKSTVARGIVNLEKQGYIYRLPDQNDKRILRVYPTDKMLNMLPNIRTILKDWNHYLTEDIDENDINIFNSVLMRIEEKAKEYMKNREEDTK